MNKIKKQINKRLIINILLSILYVVAIITLILSIKKNTFIMICSIAYLVIGFYALPMLWINFGNLTSYKGLINAIENEQIYDVNTLMLQLNLEKQIIQEKIRYIIEKGYIKGFIFDGEQLNVNNKIVNKNNNVKYCPSCGAILSFKDGKLFCSYCGFKEQK